MAKRVWDLRSALRVLKDADEKRKLITMNGGLTLGTAGAVDYLKKVHGYRVL